MIDDKALEAAQAAYLAARDKKLGWHNRVELTIRAYLSALPPPAMPADVARLCAEVAAALAEIEKLERELEEAGEALIWLEEETDWSEPPAPPNVDAAIEKARQRRGKG